MKNGLVVFARVTVMGIASFISIESIGQSLAAKVAAKYRSSAVFLAVNKTTATGEFVTEYGTGFVVTEKGHVLTSCHVVDKKILNDDGSTRNVIVDSVEVKGAIGSRAGALEPISMLRCAQGGADLALLKFKNTALRRFPVPVANSSPALGDALASLGFPLNTEFFVRQGTLGGDADDDLMTVDMTLNPGDSGGPVFSTGLMVVAVAEAGYSGGTGIGIVRPIRHAAGLLAEAGVVLTAVDATIPSVPLANAPENSNVEISTHPSAISIFAAASGEIPVGTQNVKITYPVSMQFKLPDPSIAPPPTATNSLLEVTDYPAKPGYKIVSAKFIIAAKEGINVLPVSPASNGQIARVAFLKTTKSQFSSDNPAFVRGFIETNQVKIDMPQVHSETAR